MMWRSQSGVTLVELVVIFAIIAILGAAVYSSLGNVLQVTESKGASDTAEAVRTAVINKRAGGMGLISGRKAFQKPMKDGIQILNAIQDVYLAREITVA